MQEKENQLKIQEDKIKADYQKYEIFMRDNENKRLKAIRRINDETKDVESKEAELASILADIAAQEKIKERHQLKTKNLEVCFNFLQEVVLEYSEEYPEISDLLQRYKNLQQSISKLKEQNSKIEFDLENCKSETLKFEKEKNNRILVLNNEIAILQSKLEVGLIRHLKRRRKKFRLS